MNLYGRVISYHSPDVFIDFNIELLEFASLMLNYMTDRLKPIYKPES